MSNNLILQEQVKQKGPNRIALVLMIDFFYFWCLMPLSAIFQLYHHDIAEILLKVALKKMKK